MRKADVGEWILSLTTTPERAASIAGDLLEGGGNRGALWFWGSLIGTAASLAWQAFSEAPLRLTGLAFIGAILQVFYMIVAAIGILIVRVAMILFGAATQSSSDPVGFISQVAILGTVESMMAFAVGVFLFGPWLVKRAPRRELPVYVICWLLFQVVWLALLLFRPAGILSIGFAYELSMNALSTVLGAVLTFLGVILARRRTALS